MNRLAWSAVNYGVHGPSPPPQRQAGAAVFTIPLRGPEPEGWTPTCCYVWTLDEGEWVSLTELNRWDVYILDGDFELDAERVAGLRLQHANGN
ncbi:hypothetical protein EVJ58_g10608 [Rhodofomes roseus]|uniref:Uncharacterized protein n=1 Tax=Rhodofomes roseus TaxID=34475 RepID=A0A4Y9XPT1_9APHY|nr:hypothetical protein EVJ58_g10608 [Rhodofomes roseus]